MSSTVDLKVIILEDEAIASRRLARMLKEIPDKNIEIIKIFVTVEALIEYLEKNDHPDVLLLDIMVADGSSFELFEHIVPQCPYIFITAYDEFAVKAFRKHALDYILKPIKQAHLNDAFSRLNQTPLEKILQSVKEISPYKESFLLRFANKFHIVRSDEISFIYSLNKMAFFYLRNGVRVPSDMKLQELILQLDPQHFIRANRQFIIRRNAIKEVIVHSRARLRVILEPESPESLIISTEMTPKFKKWLAEH